MTVIGPRTKGLRLTSGIDPAAVVGRRIDDGVFSWPLLTLDEAALTHNITTAADVCARAGVRHAPHVKTHMSRQLWERQAAAGAWGPSVAHPGQLRTVADWGAGRALLANELTDPRDAAWLRGALERATLEEVWLEVDSTHGVGVLEREFSGADPVVVSRLGVLLEVGVRGGRTGLREPGDVVALARRVRAAGLGLRGIAGYEGSVAEDVDPAGRAAVGAWCDQVRSTAELIRAEGLLGEESVLTAGGSTFLDIVLDRWAGAPGFLVVVRAGAYVTHDHGHYTRADPWSRIPGADGLVPAISVWAQVLSVPEPGLALLGVGRRDVGFDLDLPHPLVARATDRAGRLAPARRLASADVVALNDQHAFVSFDPAHGALDPGDVISLGVSHPCTTLDKWRVAAVTRGDVVTALYTLDF